MSGHSKWSSIKHKKAARDSKRGKLFTKLIKEITIAARLGGGDINSNPRLRTAVTTARAQSMPNDNIDRAIKKGTGELGGGQLEEVVYEGYGPGGVAIITDVLTDNRNRVVAELRFILSRHGGNLGESNCVGWMFKKRGVITVERSAIDEDRLMELALEAGADDVVADGESFPGDDRARGVQRRARRAGSGQDSDGQRRGGQDSREYGAGLRPYRRAGAEADGGARGSRRGPERRRQLRHQR